MSEAAAPIADAGAGHRAKLSVWRLLAVVAFAFTLTLISSTIDPPVLTYKIRQLLPGNHNVALGLTTTAGLIVALLTQPLVGVISDRTRSRFGRRLPFFILGTAMATLTLYLIASAPVFGVFVAAVLINQVSTNTIQGPWQALIPDHVPAYQRGQAAGMRAMFDILGLIVGRVVAGAILGRYAGELPLLFPTASPDNYIRLTGLGSSAPSSLAIATVSVLVIALVIALLVTTFGERAAVRERLESQTPTPPENVSLRKMLKQTYSVDFHAYPAFRWWFANRLLFWAAFIILNTFLINYGVDVLKMSAAEANRYFGQMTVIIGVALLLAALPGGWLTDKIGRKPLTIVAGVIAAVGVLVVLVSRDLSVVTVGGALLGLGIGIYVPADWALITDIVPRAEAARYLGIANVATTAGSALARLLGGLLIDPINAAFNSNEAGYMVVYGLAFVFCVLAIVAIWPLKVPSSEFRVLSSE